MCAMLQLAPHGRFSWKYAITKDGVPIGVLELTRMKWGGEFYIDKVRYELKREGVIGPLALRHDGRVVARAQRISLRARYRIVAEDRSLELLGGFMRRNARLTHGEVPVANISRPGFMSRGVSVESHQNVPTRLLVFAAAVIILYWRTSRRGAAS